ncbi:hypothetical protein S245_010730, partial [Arachis hypogaea]
MRYIICSGLSIIGEKLNCDYTEIFQIYEEIISIKDFSIHTKFNGSLIIVALLNVAIEVISASWLSRVSIATSFSSITGIGLIDENGKGFGYLLWPIIWSKAASASHVRCT